MRRAHNKKKRGISLGSSQSQPRSESPLATPIKPNYVDNIVEEMKRDPTSTANYDNQNVQSQVKPGHRKNFEIDRIKVKYTDTDDKSIKIVNVRHHAFSFAWRLKDRIQDLVLQEHQCLVGIAKITLKVFADHNVYIKLDPYMTEECYQLQTMLLKIFKKHFIEIQKHIENERIRRMIEAEKERQLQFSRSCITLIKKCRKTKKFIALKKQKKKENPKQPLPPIWKDKIIQRFLDISTRQSEIVHINQIYFDIEQLHNRLFKRFIRKLLLRKHYLLAYQKSLTKTLKIALSWKAKANQIQRKREQIRPKRYRKAKINRLANVKKGIRQISRQLKTFSKKNLKLMKSAASGEYQRQPLNDAFLKSKYPAVFFKQYEPIPYGFSNAALPKITSKV